MLFLVSKKVQKEIKLSHLYYNLIHCMMTCPSKIILYLPICCVLFFGTTLCYNIEVKKAGIARGPEGSQFGYTVALVRAPGWTYSSTDFHAKELLIGAPNVTYNNVNGHGQVFRCTRLTDQNIICGWLNVTDTSNFCAKLSRNTDTNCATESRLGATMEVNRKFQDVRRDTNMPMVTVCAPGWKNVYPETNQGKYHNNMIGMCLRMRDDLKTMKCTRDSCWPFMPDSTTVSQDGRPAFSFAQAGMSAAFTVDGRCEIIAAPGADFWRGAYKAVQKKLFKRLDSSEANTIYFGYAITAGSFWRTSENIVSGSPNWNDPPNYGHYGRVEIFLETTKTASIEYGFQQSCTDQQFVDLRQTINIDQMGSKFGAAVEAVDLTGDGLDELLVGAPLYTGDRPEEGRVFVYTSSKKSKSNMMVMCGPIGVLSGGAYLASLREKTSFARFGSAIVSAGDLDHDGYNDVAIGAPYEDDGTGAIYVYHGIGECGCKMEDMFAQRIAGKDIHTGIRAFGWSIYGNEDIDDNSFTDLAVGAYESNTVVVLRTRPIVNVSVEIKMSPNPIPLDGSLIKCSKDNVSLCFEVTVIFHFNSTGTRNGNVSDITLRWTLDSDTVHKNKEGWSRVEFRDTKGQGKWTENITLSSIRNRMFSTQYVLDVKLYKGKPEPKDAWTKVRMEGSYELSPTSGDNFAVLDPILHNNTKKEIIEYIEFDKKCDINTCTSNLKLAVEMFLIKDGVTATTVENDTVIYVDAMNILEITADVVNLLNSSYRAVLNGEVTTIMQRDASPNNGLVSASCKDESLHKTNTNISCTADSKLDRNENMNVKMYFDISRQRLVPDMNMTKMKKYVHIFFKADQANKDVNEENNIFVKKIGIKLKHRIRIEEDNDVSDQIRYKADVTSTRMITLIHRFYIINDGPSFLPKTYVNVTVPLSKGETDVAVIKNLPEMCKIRGESPLVQMTTPGSATEKTTKRYSILPDTDVERKRREAIQEPTPANRTEDKTGELLAGKRITCEEYTYATIECQVLNLEQSKNEKEKYIDITIGVYEKELAKEKEVRTIQYVTNATVTDPFIWYGGKVVPWDRTVYAEKWTTFMVETSSVVSEVSIWIIIGSALGALVLLLIVIIVLWRCGFFNRKMHSQVQQWKRTSLYTQHFENDE